MHDLVYLENGKIFVSESAMQIQEFIDFKRYDRSEGKAFFEKAMAYIYFVYKVFGLEGENVSYLHNLPLAQRKIIAVRDHCKPYTLHDMEENRWVNGCVQAYMNYSYTAADRLLDAYKTDVDKYVQYVQSIPIEHTAEKKVVYKDPVTNEDMTTTITINVPNIQERMSALKSAQEYSKLFLEWSKQSQRDQRIKRSQARLFEDDKVVKNINTDGFPIKNQE